MFTASSISFLGLHFNMSDRVVRFINITSSYYTCTVNSGSIDVHTYLVHILQPQHVGVIQRFHGRDFTPQLLRRPCAHVILVHDLDRHCLSSAGVDA